MTVHLLHWIEALEADQRTLYSRFLKFLVVPALIAYSVWVMVVPASQEPLHLTPGSMVRYVSPEGVRMVLTEALPRWRLLLHSVSGVLMIVASLAQKHSSYYMLQNMRDKAFPPLPGQKKSSASSFLRSRIRVIHTNFIGPCTLGFMAVMALGGFMMRSWSTLSNFDTMMWLFVAPWPLLGGTIYFSAKIASNTSGNGAWATAAARVHVIVGNALVWACVAVAFARLVGASLQRFTPHAHNTICHLGQDSTAANIVCRISEPLVSSPEEQADSVGYYRGIAIATVVFSLVIILEAAIFLKASSAIRTRNVKLWETAAVSEESNKKKQ